MSSSPAILLWVAGLLAAAGIASAAEPAPGPVLTAPSGHRSNYDEAKVGSYALPDPLRTSTGARVTTAAEWWTHRRPEILETYRREIYGRVPASAPGPKAEISGPAELVEDGRALRRNVVLRFGPEPGGPSVHLVVYTPAHANGPVPAVLQLVFFRGLPDGGPEAPLPPVIAKLVAKGEWLPETAPPRDVLDRGYAYATFRYTDVQPDDQAALEHGVIGLARDPAASRAPDSWGTISAWAWATSRVLDYLTTDRAIDARRVALVGHSRLGKTVLWAGATDSRFALIFSSCSGEMGAALARRDYGETVDDMAARFPWQFAGNFVKYVGHWNDLPVDAHELIALNAPRPVFITGGTADQWADPKGEFLAEVAATPVYRLLGRRGLPVADLPPIDQAVTDGDLGWRYHRGGHAILPDDWKAFLDFADRHLHPAAAPR